MNKIKLAVSEEDLNRIVAALNVHADSLETGVINLTASNNPVVPHNLRGYVATTRQADLASKARQLAKTLLECSEVTS